MGFTIYELNARQYRRKDFHVERNISMLTVVDNTYWALYQDHSIRYIFFQAVKNLVLHVHVWDPSGTLYNGDRFVLIL